MVQVVFTSYRLLFLTLFLAGLTACSAAQSTAPTPTPASTPTSSQAYEGTILAYGNSLTEGFGLDDPGQAYPAQLERKLQAEGYNYRVVNAGISGETSSAALSRLDFTLDNLDPDIVILETGGNDGLRGVDLDLTEENIRRIVQRFQAEDVIIVLAGLQMIQNLGVEYTTQFAEMYPAIAAEEDLILIPFFLEGVAADPDLNQPDFIHPTAEGYRVVVDHIYPYVLEAIEEHRQRE